MSEENQVHIELGRLSPVLEGIEMFYYGGGPLSSNVYLLDKGRVMVDTGNCAELLMEYESRYPGAKVEKVIITHAHPDHITGLFMLLSRFSPQIYIHQAELDAAVSGKTLRDFFKEIGKEHLLVPLKGNEDIEAGEFKLKVLYTPGHTPGSICLYIPERGVLFSSDTLFPMGEEYSLLPAPDPQGGRLEELAMSVRFLMRLNVRAFLPGHLMPVVGETFSHMRRTYFELQLQVQGREDMAYINTGIVLADLGRLEEAIECFDRVLEKDPKHPGACFVKGLAMMQKARFKEAVELFDRALEVYPDFKEAREARERALIAMSSPQNR